MDALLEQLSRALGPAYRIERELGGGMSRVFLAMDTTLGRQVVIKVLPPDLGREVSTERFNREIALAARLQHAHIVPLLTAGEAGGITYFTMPYVEGETLRARLSGGELPIPEVVRILRDVAGALAHAHARGVIHRDIKPENILLSEGTALVSDFGVSKAVAEAGADRGATFTSVGVALGTPAYMAPEQVAADARIDHRADIYAFGVVAFEMLTGRSPFGGRPVQAMMAAHVMEPAPPVQAVRPTTPASLAALVDACLAKSPADRPQQARSLIEVLESVSTPTSTEAITLAPTRASGRWRIVAGVAALVLVLGGATWAFLHKPAESAFDERRVAVIPFVNLTGDDKLSVIGRIAAEEFSRSVAQTDSADVVASGAVEAALGAAGTGATDAAHLVATATRSAIVITGSYSTVRDSLRMEARLVDGRNGKVVRVLDPVMGPIADPMVSISALRERLLSSIVSGDVARRVVIGSPPPKYSAYLEYVEGTRTFTRNQAASRASFERAIAIDSTFVMAYTMLAATYTNAGRFDKAEEVTDALVRHRSELSAFDRRMLEYLQVHNSYRAADILPVVQELYRRSGDPLMNYLTGFWALRLLKPGLALAALRQSDSALTAVGWVGQARDLATAHHQMGDYRAELAALDRGARLLPQFATSYRFTRLRAWAGLHDTTAALAFIDTLLAGLSRPDSITTLTNLSTIAREFEAHGDSAAAVRIDDRLLGWFYAHRSPRPSSQRAATIAYLWFDRRNLDSAEAHARLVARDTGSAAVVANGYLGVIAAIRGDSARASHLADSLGAQTRKWDLGLSAWWRAAILANLGRREAAVQGLVQAARDGQSMAAWHYHTALRPLRNYPAYEALIKPNTSPDGR